MCNDYRLKVDIETIRRDFADLRIRIRFPEGIPNVQPREDVRITDTAPIVRAALAGNGGGEAGEARSGPAPLELAGAGRQAGL